MNSQATLTRLLVILGIASLVGCGGGPASTISVQPPVNPAPPPTTNPVTWTSVAVAPDQFDKVGKFAYATNSDSNKVLMYSINPTRGSLALTGSVAAGTEPMSVAVDPSGKFVYVADEGSNDISMYTITATGSLDPVGHVAAGVAPTSIAVDPS